MEEGWIRDGFGGEHGWRCGLVRRGRGKTFFPEVRVGRILLVEEMQPLMKKGSDDPC